MLMLIRGLPGSGKSELAKQIVLGGFGGWIHLEADFFFHTIVGYQFDKTRIKEAHSWCQETTKSYLSSKYNVCVANTFSQIWEMQPYINMAREFNIQLFVLECQNNFGSIHGVPKEAIERMKQRWEKYNAQTS